MPKIISLIILSLIFVSCSGKKREQTKVLYTASLIGGVSFSGSLAVWGSSDNGDEIAIPFGAISSADQFNIPNGNWTFFAIGWEGANNFEGTTKCGQASVTLGGGEATVSLTLNAANCSGSSFTSPSHVVSNQFLPLKIIGCYNPGVLTSGETCSNSNKANISSIKVKLLSNTLDPSKTLAPVYSQCFFEVGPSSGVHTTALTLPTAPGVNFPFHFSIEAYSDAACATFAEEFEVKDSMLVTSSTHETYTDGTYTELFLISSNQGTAGTPVPTGLTMVTGSPGNTATPQIQISNLTATNTIKIFTDNTCTTQVHTQAITSATETFSISNTPLTIDGDYTFYAIQTAAGIDSVCSAASDVYTYDASVPSVPTSPTLTSALNNSNATISVSGLEVGATVELHGDGGCSSLQHSFTATATTESGTIAALADAAYTIFARQVDAAGNASGCSGVSANFTIDTVAPTAPSAIALNTPASSPGTNTTPVLTVTFAEASASVELFSDNTCATPVGTSGAVASPANVSTSVLAEATHTIYATVTDAAGNVSPCSTAFVTYEVDITIPTVTGLTNDAGVYQTYNWNWGCDETCTYDYEITQNPTPTFPNAFSGTTTDSQISGDGIYYIHVRAMDAAGNISTTVSVWVELDNTAPTHDPTKIPYFDEIQYTNGNLVRVYWGGFSELNPNTNDVLVYTDSSCTALYGQYNLGATSPAYIPDNLANGSYWVKVRAIDEATNQMDTPCSKMYAKVDTGFANPAWYQFDNGTFMNSAGAVGIKPVVSMAAGPPKAIAFGGQRGTPLTSRDEFRPIDGSGSISTYTNAGGQAFINSGVVNKQDSLDFYVFGGLTQAGALHTGTNLFNRYTVNVGTPTPLSIAGAPSGRFRHAMVHTGTKICVWGGYTNSAGSATGADGACYDISGTTWSAMSASPLSPRAEHVAEWVGNRMCIWGGIDHSGAIYNNGACYDPIGNSWTTMATAPIGGRTKHKSVWTGKEICIWGGENGVSTSYQNGACYDPLGDSWRMIGGTPPALGTVNFNMLWTGARMCIIGGHEKYVSTAQTIGAACWSPIYDTWNSLNTSGFPAAIESGAVFMEDDICLISGYTNTASPAPVATTTCIKVR